MRRVNGVRLYVTSSFQTHSNVLGILGAFYIVKLREDLWPI